MRNEALSLVNGGPVEVKRYLDQVFVVEDQLRACIMMWEKITGRAYSPHSSADLSRPQVQTSPPPEAPFVSLLENREELEKQLEQKIGLCQALKQQMFLLINSYTSGLECSVLISHYVFGKTWKEIGEELKYTPRHLQRICKTAREKIVLPENAIWI